MDMANVLGKIGLTEQESRTYVALLELQESKTGILCRKARIASSNIYGVLHSLIRKGLVSYRLQNNVKIFMPSPPETLRELFRAKQEELDKEEKNLMKAISLLKTEEEQDESYSNYKYFEGISGIKAMWYEINRSMADAAVNRIYASRQEGYTRLLGFWDEHNKIRDDKGIKAKILIPEDDKELGLKRRKEGAEVRFIRQNNLVEWGTIKDHLWIHQITGKEPRGFLIKDPVFAQSFEDIFDQVFDRADE